MNFIWLTRGHSWGFRFLRTGGYEDPLVVHEECFDGIGEEPEAWRRVDDKVALRFLDPRERRDAAGRVIPHEFVLLGAWSAGVNSLDGGFELVWPLVEEEYGRIWNQSEPPPTRD
jgi:hypothetical protein